MSLDKITLKQAQQEIMEDVIQRGRGKFPIEVDDKVYYVDKPVLQLIDHLMFQINNEIPKN